MESNDGFLMRLQALDKKLEQDEMIVPVINCQRPSSITPGTYKNRKCYDTMLAYT